MLVMSACNEQVEMACISPKENTLDRDYRQLNNQFKLNNVIAVAWTAFNGAARNPFRFSSWRCIAIKRHHCSQSYTQVISVENQETHIVSHLRSVFIFIACAPPIPDCFFVKDPPSNDSKHSENCAPHEDIQATNSHRHMAKVFAVADIFFSYSTVRSIQSTE